MPIRVSSNRRCRQRSQRARYSSGSSCSTFNSCSGTSSSSHRRCCQCCCHHLSTVASMFSTDDGIGLTKSDASTTLLVWLLLVLQFLVKCIRFFSIHYELTNVAEKNSLYSFLNQYWPPPPPPPREEQRTKRRRHSGRSNGKAKNHRVSKGYFTATTRSEASSSELLLSPVVVGDVATDVEEKLKKRTIVTVPSQLSPLYTSPPKDGSRITETNYVTCLFEVSGPKVLEVVDDIRKELYLWRQVDNLVTVCCEMTWAVAPEERHIPSETSIQQTVHEHMQLNQQRINDLTLTLYHAKGWLKTLPCQQQPFAPVVQQNCVSRNGATLGCYRRLYPALLPLVHAETAEVHEPYWALHMTNDPPPPNVITSNGRRSSTFKLNLICVTLDG